jgi:radical SAM enzyme (TIGR01210 family)
MQSMKELRKKGLEKFKGKTSAVSWREEDFIDGPVKAGVVILPTIGCRWGRKAGCIMCGYVYDAARKIDQEQIVDEFEKAVEKLGDIEYLKIFTSGSFLDTQELSAGSIRKIISLVPGSVKRLQIESRPEFVKEKVLREIKKSLEGELEIGIGLESANDRVRKAINKGFSFSNFEKAVAVCKKNDVLVKAYLLLKAPFLTEKEAIEDAKDSIIKAQGAGADRMSINPMNIQRGTIVEKLWRSGDYRPPWLWSVVDVLLWASEHVDIPVLSHPTAAGKRRGTHNCGKCDNDIYRGIMKYSTSQDAKSLEFDCDCKNLWKETLELEMLEH